MLDKTKILVGSRTTEFTLVDYPTMDDRLSNEGLKSSGRAKQEIKIIVFLDFYIRYTSKYII
ncbi:MAG: hypothetical protein M0R03_17595, partial [Novosphingobium sp.]|nr:hypothetical protein [Novosphingobium sp.]